MVGIIVIFIFIGWFYLEFIIKEKNKLRDENYRSEALLMQKKADSLILAKQKSTVAIALSMANDKNLSNDILENNISQHGYEDLISKLNEYTFYKNIWVQIFDKDLNSMYKSWDKTKGENKKEFRGDILKAVLLKKPLFSINSGMHDLSIRAIVPLFREDENIGAIEVISHFNSISKEMQNFGIESVVVLEKEQNKYLKNPFTKMFIDKYYVANFDASDAIREYLRKEGIENYFNSSYKIKDNYIIATNELKDMDNRVIGYYIMFKDLESVSNKNLDFFMIKWIALSVLGLLIFVAVIVNVIYIRNKKQKMYYKNIIDSSSNIVIVLDKNSIIDVNKKFFEYFYNYTTLEGFKKEHKSISDFFVKEDGYVCEDADGSDWIECLIKNPHKNQIKIRYDSKEYYFSAGVSLISEQDEHYSAIFADITKEKIYQQELEYINVTDTLTKIGNRYYYNQQIKKEVANSNRYSYPLSLVIFDIDYFKKINDEHGHDIGDKILIEYAEFISSHLREGDVFCRIGGEEFTIILPHTNKENAYYIIDKMRGKIEAYKEIVPVTMSFGVAEYVKDESLELFFKRADEALYEAKNSGRNRVMVK
ncbi:MAG: diguanylate cyclase [Sulfurimonas sp. RIFOXYD12_FULL_36_11]|uniref:sensor domain-containing diguanylate cyclase n=1 Tax=Sulfurimonas sp. RIFOXYB12_FULL_35_9 TaxID=1802256 RepID=UPI0008CF4FE6|nr:diguanylate cyclase [Sulfurimonas sp. RIFOXYB12_FULL_35_9]MBS4067011.1 diguanylate cyclase [Sulfurimonas sp.]MDO8260250.1 diguanylate cyclase [Candidatus Magasanikbacteria bacterium]OHE06863.1 MAG: diguanylate cyclase [Sulfurimonas sp. RIFOXYB2_FULL_37_5]OHE11015.1 MAG: diguanylate cyclase [Sulfurimonas sp. RIFOXYC2_FULL_36_7]OHE12280.1 MAG: diguanylate cyclase [Sulfurimonas sp. RIFOXYD12_FULL_36_11]